MVGWQQVAVPVGVGTLIQHQAAGGHCGTGAEPVSRLQVLDVRRVLAGDVDGGGWRGWLVKPGLTGGLCV